MLTLTRLESRDNPAPLIPGWSGPEQHAYGHFDADGFPDTVAVAQDGGSVHLYVIAGPRSLEEIHDGIDRVILNVIVFDENFRGGGRIAVIPHSPGDFSTPDALLVTAGPGGGPHVAKFDFATGERFDFFAPYSTLFRGGLRISHGDIDRDGKPEALFLPESGGSPHLVAVDMATYETELSIYVGNADDMSGAARFESTGGTIQRPGGNAVVIQYGETADYFAETRLFPY